MGNTETDRRILRELAERYTEIASEGINRRRLERYRKTVGLERVRPVVLIDEVPWGEIDDEALVERCEDPIHRGIERRLRRTIYQWDHFQVDLVVPNEFEVPKVIESTGIGVEIEEVAIASATGSYASAHEYHDQLATDEDLDRMVLPRISYDRDETERIAGVAADAFDGLLDVVLTGTTLSYNIWDRIATFRGVDKLLMDLAMRPGFMHRIARRFTEIAESIRDQYLELGLLEPHPRILHCTPAVTDELPAKGFDGTVRLEDVWGRCSAQIFSAVSPAMHDEFDLVYNQRLFGGCGLLYYGCCEPLDAKVSILRKRFANLRKISITPWADPVRAAEEIGSDYVLAAKPNPAFVNSPRFDPKPVEDEVRTVLEACRRNATPVEFVLKDVSTIARTPTNLTRWAETVEGLIDRYEPA